MGAAGPSPKRYLADAAVRGPGRGKGPKTVNPNCPGMKKGPRLRFFRPRRSSPAPAQGRNLLVVPQKSGVIWAAGTPDKQGEGGLANIAMAGGSGMGGPMGRGSRWA